MNNIERIHSIIENVTTLLNYYSSDIVPELKLHLNRFFDRHPQNIKNIIEEFLNMENPEMFHKLAGHEIDKKEVMEKLIEISNMNKIKTIEYLSKCIANLNDISFDYKPIDVIHKLSLTNIITKEAGWFWEFHRNFSLDTNGNLNTSTDILFLLEKSEIAEQFSYWHILKTDEKFTWLGGEGMLICEIDLNMNVEEVNLKTILLNVENKEHVFKAGFLYGAKIASEGSGQDIFSLISCKCIPSFMMRYYIDPHNDDPEAWNTLVHLYVKYVIRNSTCLKLLKSSFHHLIWKALILMLKG